MAAGGTRLAAYKAWKPTCVQKQPGPKSWQAKNFVRVLKRIIGTVSTTWGQGEEEAEKTPMGHLLVQPWPLR